METPQIAPSAQILLRLADKLEGVGAYAEAGPVPSDRFDLQQFVWNPSTRDLVDFSDVAEEGALNDCGTVACAIGWAATDPWFIERAERARRPETWIGFLESLLPDLKTKFAADRGLSDVGDVGYLFLAESYGVLSRRDPRAVARRIRSYVKMRWGIESADVPAEVALAQP